MKLFLIFLYCFYALISIDIYEYRSLTILWGILIIQWLLHCCEFYSSIEMPFLPICWIYFWYHSCFRYVRISHQIIGILKSCESLSCYSSTWFVFSFSNRNRNNRNLCHLSDGKYISKDPKTHVRRLYPPASGLDSADPNGRGVSHKKLSSP